MTHDRDVLALPYTAAYYEIRQLNPNSPRAVPFIDAEIRRQTKQLEDLRDDLERRLKRGVRCLITATALVSISGLLYGSCRQPQEARTSEHTSPPPYARKSYGRARASKARSFGVHGRADPSGQLNCRFGRRSEQNSPPISRRVRHAAHLAGQGMSSRRSSPARALLAQQASQLSEALRRGSGARRSVPARLILADEKRRLGLPAGHVDDGVRWWCRLPVLTRTTSRLRTVQEPLHRDKRRLRSWYAACDG